jgi:MinD superfamily P-loop ATPase
MTGKIVLLILAFALFFAVSCQKKVSSITSATPAAFYSIEQDNCIACGKCIDVCPHNAIVFQGDKPYIIQSKCKMCGQCVLICPQDAIQ